MLDAFIIEEIKRREREAERRRDQNRPRQEIPIPDRRDAPRRQNDEDAPESDRGVIIVDYTVNYA